MPPFPESRRCLTPFQGNLFSLHCLDFQAEDRLTPQWHVGQPCGKASWESLVEKHRGKDTDPLIHVKGSVTLLLELGRKRTCMPPLETRTDSPGETTDVPQDPCQHSRGSTRVPPSSRGAPFPPPSSRGGILSLRGRERIPGVPVASQRRRSPQERREELQGCATIPRVPQMSHSIPGKPVFPALPRLSSRGSTHTTVARGTALWECLVGKPRLKASRESP